MATDYGTFYYPPRGGSGGGGSITPGVTPIVGGTPYMNLYVDAGGFVDQSSVLFDTNGTGSVDFWNRTLTGGAGGVDWSQGFLNDSTGQAVISWSGQSQPIALLDSTGANSILWDLRQLVGSGGGSDTVINWSGTSSLGFFGVTPVTQQSGDIPTALANLGLVTAGTVSGATIGSPVSGGTPGSALFVDASGNLGQDNPHFVWNESDNSLIIGTNGSAGPISLQVQGGNLTVPPDPGPLNISYNLDPSNPYFIADGTDRFFTIYTYYKGAKDIVGLTADMVDPNDAQGYDVALSWSGVGSADGYYVYDVNANQYVDAGNTSSFTLTGLTVMIPGAPPSSPTTYEGPAARFEGDVTFGNNVSVSGVVSAPSMNSTDFFGGTFHGAFSGGAATFSTLTANGTTAFNGATTSTAGFTTTSTSIATIQGGMFMSSALRFQLTTITTSGTINNLSAINSNFIRLTAATGVTGIAPTTAGTGSGQILHIWNNTGASITIFNNNAGSSAANRIINPGGADLIVPSNGVWTGIYQATTDFWQTITPTQLFSSTLSGLAPLSGGGTTNFLRADGTWAAPGGSGSGTVTSVGFSVPASSIFTATGSPVTTSGTLGLTVTGISGGIPYFDTTSTLSSSAALTNHALILGGGAGAAPTALASLGTTTTVLHGNASGAPTFGAVLLTGDVSGILPLANGGTAANITAAAGGAVYSTASALAVTAAGTSGQYLKSNGTSAPAFTAFKAPTIQQFLSGTGTYTTPTSPAPIYIRVVGVGAGGGGAGSALISSANGGAGGTGGNTTFGTTLIVASGGSGGGGGTNGGSGGTGGAASLGSGPVGIAAAGSGGGGAQTSVTGSSLSGGMGGASALGGAGSGATGTGSPTAGMPNTGGGGGGAEGSNLRYSGSGGGSGGYVDAIITSLLATYSYAVGTAGTAGTAGTSGSAGAAGGSGGLTIYEYYA